jgi:hypothetical protein
MRTAWRSAGSTVWCIVLRFLLAEADLIMPVDGYPTLTDLTPDSLRRVR